MLQAVKIRSLAPLAFVFALPLAGCVKKPEMKVHHAELTGVRVGIAIPPQIDVGLTVVMEVYNPNSYDVAVRRVQGMTLLAGKYQIPVNYNAPQADGFWIQSKSRAYVPVPIQIPAQLGWSILQEAYGATLIPYRFSGRADVTAFRSLKLEKDDYKVDEQGSIPRAQFENVLRGM